MRLWLFRLRLRLVSLLDWPIDWLIAGAFALLRALGPVRAPKMLAALARRVGPWLPEHRVGQRQLRAAFPERDAAWIEATLRGVWDNLGRVAGEYVHLEHIWDYDLANPNTGRIVTDQADVFELLRDDGKPALIFSAHLGNWELPALAAARHGMQAAVVYRMPNNKAVARRISAIRQGVMGRLIRTRREAVFEMVTALEHGEHLGMLVDQHWSRGVDIDFFGRPCKANPTLARLARQFDCPVHGVRVIRLPGGRFRLDGTGPMDFPRDPDGRINVAGATQMINTVVEGWVREHPEQWLWLHRRWR